MKSYGIGSEDQEFTNGRAKNLFFASISLVFVAFAADAKPTARQICAKMISENRGGGLSPRDCKCNYKVADAVLDYDIKSLLFDSWYNGTNNMNAIESLPKQGRIKRQIRTLQKSIKANCG